MEYFRGGELFKKVAKRNQHQGVYYRDLKPENILMDEIENLGLSALLDTKRLDGLLHTTCGTSAYVAPKVIKRGYDGEKADI
ncbi:hypothetical protein H5410_042584 [Solanum commersonii]|uniref:Protein kinase domain-containing protein n=1 Tax=Solanum commersonii TaxID=4109 RepID=A0A9J5XZ04_SOLCO|nr:hypothetical protein H5410_042584 [Solanum commersonii]